METARRIEASPFPPPSNATLGNKCLDLNARIERLQRELWQANAEQAAAYIDVLRYASAIADGVAANSNQDVGLRNHARIFANTLITELGVVKGINNRAHSGGASAGSQTATSTAAMTDTRCENVDLIVDAPYHGVLPQKGLESIGDDYGHAAATGTLRAVKQPGDFTGTTGGNHETI